MLGAARLAQVFPARLVNRSMMHVSKPPTKLFFDLTATTTGLPAEDAGHDIGTFAAQAGCTFFPECLNVRNRDVVQMQPRDRQKRHLHRQWQRVIFRLGQNPPHASAMHNHIADTRIAPWLRNARKSQARNTAHRPVWGIRVMIKLLAWKVDGTRIVPIDPKSVRPARPNSVMEPNRQNDLA